MAFTITCDKCGNKETFKQGDRARSKDIDMEIGMSSDYQPYPVDISFFCENVKCNNYIDLKY